MKRLDVLLAVLLVVVAVSSLVFVVANPSPAQTANIYVGTLSSSGNCLFLSSNGVQYVVYEMPGGFISPPTGTSVAISGSVLSSLPAPDTGLCGGGPYLLPSQLKAQITVTGSLVYVSSAFSGPSGQGFQLAVYVPSSTGQIVTVWGLDFSQSSTGTPSQSNSGSGITLTGIEDTVEGSGTTFAVQSWTLISPPIAVAVTKTQLAASGTLTHSSGQWFLSVATTTCTTGNICPALARAPIGLDFSQSSSIPSQSNVGQIITVNGFIQSIQVNGVGWWSTGIFVQSWSAITTTMSSSQTMTTLTVRGVVVSGVEAGCLILQADNGQTYLLVDVPDMGCALGGSCSWVGQYVTVIGYIDPNVISYCMQGNAALRVSSIGGVSTTTSSSTLTARTVDYTATISVGNSAILPLATNPSTGCSWWIQSQPSGVQITSSSGTDPNIVCAPLVAGCSNLLTIYSVKGLVPGDYVIEFRNGHAWAQTEYYSVALLHLTVLPQGETETTEETQTIMVTTSTVYTTTTQSNGFPSAPQSLQDVPRFLSQFWAWVAARWGQQFQLGGNSQPTSAVQGTVGETVTLSGSIVSISTVSQATQITVQVANANSRFQPGSTVEFIVSATAGTSRLQVGNNVRVTMSWTGSYWQATDIQLLS